MILDNAKNFAKSTLASGIDNAVTSCGVATGDGTKFPSVPFNAVVWNKTDFADPADDVDHEVVRVTAISTDTFTITRAQEGTSATNHNTGGKVYGIVAGLTAKVFNTDIQKLVPFQKITQTTHGFSVGNVIRSSGTANQFTKAKADSAANAEVIGYVVEVIDSDTFIYQTTGFVTTGVPAQAAGTVMFLDPSTAGALTTTEPTTAGQVSKPCLLIIENAVRAEILHLRGMIRVSNSTISPATGAEIDAATDVVKYATPKSIDDSSIVKAAKTQTLTNKTLTAPVLNEPTGTIYVTDQNILANQIFN